MRSTINELPNTFNIAAYLIQENLKQESNNKIAFYYKEHTYTYGQVSNLVKRSARLLSGLGVKRENRVSILLNNRPEWIFYFLGAIWLGAIPVPINPGCSVEDVNYILQDSRSVILLTSQEWQMKLSPLTSDYLYRVLLVDGQESFISLLSCQSELNNYAQTSPDEAAFWLYTSGSTGRPKGVIHAHQSITFCASQYGQETLGLNQRDITYSVANMAFAYGLGNSLYLPMAMGAASVISEANNVFDIIEDIKRYQPTVFFGIPSVYSSILELEEIASFDASSLRLCVSAAEQLPKSIWQKWFDTHSLEICEGIGTTEFLHVFLSNQLGKSKPGSSGRPVPGYEIKIIDENGLPCSIGEIGELQVQGASLMLGYWNRLSETRKAVFGSQMKTGDRYRRDRDGFFWFMGRKDELFKVNGQWISPLEIEGVLYQHPQVREVAVISESNDGQHLTEIIAYISLKEEEQLSLKLERSIYQFVKQHLPHFKAPKRIYFLAELPRTPTGKIHRQLLKNKSSDLPLVMTS
ncbi:Benzoate--CoA ligase [Hyella patelloides LEGE 07179]|uniref:Benzoate--CoA ligase n=1 Tax=Hyella patelloides LEGE 07179 TaxID=945734 RepID=A0A563W1I4_9CYAN|nr:benzoate-CoA ligase family protein [Hyella patelloides]VEP17562.1 Benzoate--CoA ligase [Hyella patelloides LEGE 07179]